jgi:hypothetical protein
VRRVDVPSLPGSAIDYVLNAFWCDGCGPAGKGVMVFGEGLQPGFVLTETGQYVDYLAGALDIVAHELTHGLTAYSSRLIYRKESGALDEAFADIVGTSVEFFYQPAGSGILRSDYLIGEDVFRPGGIRSMSNPGLFGDPDHYSRRYTGDEDEGGVHINAGIPNQAFYLAIEGGVNRTSNLSVQGVGAANREQIEKAFYRAFVYLLPSNATFSMARAATILAARDLYGAGSSAERAVVQAWTAVGVIDVVHEPSVRPTTLVFNPSVNEAISVDSYVVELRRSGDPPTAEPLAARDLGRPAVVNGEVSVDISTMVDTLPSGSYYAVVVPIGPGGTTASAPSAAFST